MAESKKMVKKEVSFMKAKGAPKSMVKHEMGEMTGMKKGGTAKYAKGGIIASKMGAVKTAAPSRDGIAQKGKTKGKNLGDSGKNVGIMGGAKGMKKGGSVSSASSRADGIAQRGKTRGTFIMCGGGMTK